MFSVCWVMLQRGVSLLHRWDLVDPKCCLCLCQVEGPAGYFSHLLLQQTKQETQAPVCVWPKMPGWEGEAQSILLFHGRFLHPLVVVWSCWALSEGFGVPSPVAEQGLLSWAQFNLVAAITKHCSPFLSSFLTSCSLLGEDFSTGVLGRIFPC